MDNIIPENLTQCTFSFDDLNAQLVEDIPQKQCSRCEQYKPATSDYFQMRSDRPSGFRSACKVCASLRAKGIIIKATPPEVLPEGYKRCTQCKELKASTPEYFYLKRDGGDKLRSICKVCNGANGKANYLAHIEERKAYGHEYNAIHAERIRAYARRHYQENIDYYTQRNRRYVVENAEKCKIYRETHLEQRRAYNGKRRALKKASQGSFTPRQIQEQYQRQKGECYYCHKKVAKDYHIEHIIPVSRGGSNDISNIVIACPTCNMRKQDKLPHEWPEGGRLC